jgi:hypothetical protein
VLEHVLRPQEPGRHGDGRDVLPAQLTRLDEREPDHGGFHEVIEDVAAIPVEIAIGDLDDEPGAAAAPLEHEWHRVMTR